MIRAAVLQNCMCSVEGATGPCSDTGVKCEVDGVEEDSIKVEETIDIKDEYLEDLTLPSSKTEREVRFWGVCEVVANHAS